MGYSNSKRILGNSVLELRGVFQFISWQLDDGQTVVVSFYNLDVG